MKRTFKFNKGQMWDGDEPIINFLEDYLLEEGTHLGSCPTMKRDCRVTIIVDKETSGANKK